MRWIPIVFAAALSLGCVSQSSLDGFGLPVGARRSGATFAVLHQPQTSVASIGSSPTP